MSATDLAWGIIILMAVGLWIISIAYDDWRSGYEGERGEDWPDSHQDITSL